MKKEKLTLLFLFLAIITIFCISCTEKEHIHTEVIDPVVPATCTEKGKTEGKHCSGCNEILIAQKDIPAKGHIEHDIEETPATCVDKGLAGGKKCSVCNEVLVQATETEPLGHDFSNGIWIITDSTQHWKKCSRCDVEDTENKTNHSAVNSDNDCTTAENCNCGRELVTAKEHDFENGEWVSTNTTQHWKKCNNCKVEDTDNKSSHDIATSCTTPTTCTCGKEIFKSHNFTEWVSDTSKHWHKCSECGTEDIENKESHNYIDSMCECGEECIFGAGHQVLSPWINIKD